MSNAFVTIKMCYVYNNWFDISCATLYVCIFYAHQGETYIKFIFSNALMKFYGRVSNTRTENRKLSAPRGKK